MRSQGLTGWLLSGALAGLVGGLPLGFAMVSLGMMGSMAVIVRAGESVAIGWAVHLAIAALVGAVFGALVRRQRLAPDTVVFWGATFGAVWWFVDPLTIHPLLTGSPLAWDLESARVAFPLLFGFLLYGAVAGLALLALRRERFRLPTRGALLRGGLAGLIAVSIVGRPLGGQQALPTFAALDPEVADLTAWLGLLLIGGFGGALFTFLVPRPVDSAGAGLVRGCMWAFVLWAVVPKTIVPLISGDGLAWSIEETRRDFAALMAFLLYGGLMGLGYQWLDAVWRGLFADAPLSDDDEGPGTQGLRALWRGALAGAVGGLLFTYVMVQIGGLQDVANLARADAELVGLIIHFIIATTWGATYGALFRRQTYDVGSAVGWGVSYAFFIWVIGPNTLMPILLGSAPVWSADTAAGLNASLIGHLAYGAALGITFHYFEARFSQWWTPRRITEAARAVRRREQLLSSAPALWALVMVVGLTFPILAGGATALPGGYSVR